MNEFIQNLSQRFQDLSQTKRVAALALIALGIASILVMTLWLQAPDYQLLYANLTEEDAAKIVEEIKSRKIPYELTGSGTGIRVPAKEVHELRLQLATLGLPEGGEVGLEIFEKTALGMTEFIQKLNYQRALQGELARTIKTLDAIDHARVHLVIPKDTLFLKEKPMGKASVVVKINRGKSLTHAQVQGIVHLVSSSVEGIAPKNVVVVDLEGNMLSSEDAMAGEGVLTTSGYKHKLKVEKELEGKILHMMEDALGSGKIIARVTADLNMENVEQTEELFDPDSQVVRSEQSNEESTVGAVPPGGIPGVQSLVPGGEDQPAGSPGSAATKSRENKTTNYEINKVVKHVVKPMGDIKKLSVSVLIDGIMAGDPPAYKARTPEEMATYLDLVKTAVGYNEQRGDQIKVENVQFDKSLMQEEEARIRKEENIDIGMTVAWLVLGVVAVFLFFRMVIRPLVHWMTTTVEVVEETEALPSPEEQAIEEEKRRLAELGTQAYELRKAVSDFVESDPKFTAGILRRWMKERSA